MSTEGSLTRLADCLTCGGTREKPILVCTYGHPVVWGGVPEVSWEGERCNYYFDCGAALQDSGQMAPCPDCSDGSHGLNDIDPGDPCYGADPS